MNVEVGLGRVTSYQRLYNLPVCPSQGEVHNKWFLLTRCKFKNWVHMALTFFKVCEDTFGQPWRHRLCAYVTVHTEFPSRTTHSVALYRAGLPWRFGHMHDVLHSMFSMRADLYRDDVMGSTTERLTTLKGSQWFSWPGHLKILQNFILIKVSLHQTWNLAGEVCWVSGSYRVTSLSAQEF